MTPWTREDTRAYIQTLESRVQDILTFSNGAMLWCQKNEIYKETIVFACIITSILWVCYNRNESVTKKEIFEILNVKGWESIEDEVLELNPKYENMDIEEILEQVVQFLD